MIKKQNCPQFLLESLQNYQVMLSKPKTKKNLDELKKAYMLLLGTANLCNYNEKDVKNYLNR